MSFKLCTAMSIEPASSASSISLVKSPFPRLCSHLRQRNVSDLVAGGLDDFDAALFAQCFEAGLNPVRLPQGKLRSSGSDV